MLGKLIRKNLEIIYELSAKHNFPYRWKTRSLCYARGRCIGRTRHPGAEATIVYSGIVNIAVPITVQGIYLNVVTGGVAATTPAWVSRLGSQPVGN